MCNYPVRENKLRPLATEANYNDWLYGITKKMQEYKWKFIWKKLIYFISYRYVIMYKATKFLFLMKGDYRNKYEN